MGLIKEYLASIEGVYIFAVISLLIFFIMFIVMIIHTYSLKKEKVEEYSYLPFDEEENPADGNAS